jgi:replicative DNA helicase
MTTLTRPLPHDLDAERALIGALMVNPDAINDVRPILKSGDIYRDEHRALFDCTRAACHSTR